MKSDSFRTVLSLIITIMVVMLGIIKNNAYSLNNNENIIVQVAQIDNVEIKELTNLDKLVLFEEENMTKFKFYTDMFGINLDDLNTHLSKDNTIYNADNLDLYLINYLFNLKKSNSKLFKNNYNNGNNFSKDYVYGLLNYFTNVYGNVDYVTLASIAYIESGNLNAKYMMQCNNIFGGMASNGLIKYSNIEYGVLSYVRMMSISYYGKGLNTVSKIATKYNPGSTTWVGNVNSVKHKFTSYATIDDINILLEKI